jgi:flagellar hook-length control protein FliK
VSERVESVSVDLRPPELGRVELRLTFQDGTVQVSMAAERGDTFEALRQDRAQLEQQMQQAGLQLSSGGLDLQHGHLPREAPEQQHVAPPPSVAEEEPAVTRPPHSDSLIDLIA